ncbi:hypothetical protein APHAL10511_002359 [Amanita phalloides]|nr:hypothetical protein APHAL10511_002359 [Amanita phalloides]
MGKAMLSHDFGTLRGHTSSMMAAIDSVHTIQPSSPFMRFKFYFAPVFYALLKVTLTSIRDHKIAQLIAHLNVLTTDLISKACKEPEDSDVHKSVLGLLVNPESTKTIIHLSLPEIATQIVCTLPFLYHSLSPEQRKNFFFLAAHESTASESYEWH